MRSFRVSWAIGVTAGQLTCGCFLAGNYEIDAQQSTAQPTSVVAASSVTAASMTPVNTPSAPSISPPIQSANASSSAINETDAGLSVPSASPPPLTSSSVPAPFTSVAPGEVDAGPSTSIDNPDPSVGRDSSVPIASATAVEAIAIYTGGDAPNCVLDADAPFDGTWVEFDDGTGDVSCSTEPSDSPGTVGCAVHLEGADLWDWGGGAGFGLNEGTTTWGVIDASEYTGVRLWLKGTTNGGHDAAQDAADNWLRVQVKAGYDGDADDWGFYCQVQDDSWQVCESTFDDLTRELNQAPPAFDRSKLRGFGVIVEPAGGADPVNFNVWIDDMTFF